MDEFKIQPDEKELRAEKRLREMDEFAKRAEMERSKRELKKHLQVGMHMLRATAEMIDAIILEDVTELIEDRKMMDKIMDMLDVAAEIQGVLGNDK